MYLTIEFLLDQYSTTTVSIRGIAIAVGWIKQQRNQRQEFNFSLLSSAHFSYPQQSQSVEPDWKLQALSR